MDEYIAAFKSLSDKTRLRIIRLLLKTKRELCICEIMDSLKLAQYNVSKHMRELKIAGLVKERKEGRFIFYSLSKPDTKFYMNLLNALNSIPENYFTDDINRMRNRLALRKNGKIIVGCMRIRGKCR